MRFRFVLNRDVLALYSFRLLLHLSVAKTLSAFEISDIEIALHRGFGISATHVPSHSDRFHINSSPLPHASQPVA